MSEDELEEELRKLLAAYGLLGFHPRDMRRCPGTGYPDWTICGPAGIMWRELKSEAGRLSRAQQDWLKRLRVAGGDADVWRPEDLWSGRIANELRALR